MKSFASSVLERDGGDPSHTRSGGGRDLGTDTAESGFWLGVRGSIGLHSFCPDR